ncbi:MAG TPA: glycosyltransferase, partial [Casimicrobiaceae bacterium]|nr:glycosyltransferase [Casimicrobiaceae bacterium]
DLRRCVDSVLACTSGPFTLVLIDDASTDPRIADYFDALASRRNPRIVLLRNAENLGFTATANRGMQRSQSDIVLLNSDTRVTRGWLDALMRCAASDARIATVTPFSNNAEICSFPRFCENNEWRAGDDPERIANALADAAVPTYPDLPTGVGFCLYVRRAAIDAIGVFDASFGAGYGEENDFCLRAAAAGFRNVLADDAFVVHTGGRSFEGRKDELGGRNLALLERLHPHYPAMVRDYIADDFLRPLREAARLRFDLGTPARRVLHVVHDRGGGTEAHVRTLIDASPDGWRHYVAVAVGDRWQIEARSDDGTRGIVTVTRRDDESWHAFLGGIVTTFDIALVHVHHLSRSREGALAALPSLGVPYGITIHDLWLACPTVTLTRADDGYCGGVTDVDACMRCLAEFPALRDTDIGAWRSDHATLLASAAFLIAPSRWAADMLARYFPQTRGRVDVIAHATLDDSFGTSTMAPPVAVTAVLMPNDDVPTVAVVGAIGRDKGARRIERLAERARERGLRIRFVVIGYLDVQHAPWQSDDALLTVHGPYVRGHLPTLFAHYRAQLVLFPSEGPESFSYTLSEAWCAAMPALVPPIGALAERVAQTQAGWVMTDDEWRDDERMLDRLSSLVSPDNADARLAASRRAAAATHPAPRAMSEATLARYAAALAAPSASRAEPRFSNERVRDALGYRAWLPPLETAQRGEVRVDAPDGVWQRVARRALAMRRTPMGRLLYRAMPEPLIDALKSRLNG